MPKLKLYRISYNYAGYYDRLEDGTYVEAVVVASSEDEAIKIHPNGHSFWNGKEWNDEEYSWADSLNKIEVEEIGMASSGLTDGEVICTNQKGA